MFKGDSADACHGKFPLTPLGRRADGLACADPGARTPIGVSRNLTQNLFVNNHNRHAKSCDHVTIGCGNIFRLWKDKDWITVEFVEKFNFILGMTTYIHVDCRNISTGVSKRSKSAQFLLKCCIYFTLFQKYACRESCYFAEFFENPNFGRGRIQTFCMSAFHGQVWPDSVSDRPQTSLLNSR